jgi:hypothetical protein
MAGGESACATDGNGLNNFMLIWVVLPLDTHLTGLTIKKGMSHQIVGGLPIKNNRITEEIATEYLMVAKR